MASNSQDEKLTVTITDVPSSAETAELDSNQPTTSHTDESAPKIVDVDENLKTGSINMGGYSSWWSNSFNSLIQTAKEKTKTALELIKTDFDEFTTTMTSDTNTLLTQITNINIAETVNPLLSNLNNTFSVSDDDGYGGFDSSRTQSGDMARPSSQQSGVPSTSIYDRYLNELRLLQSNQQTYLSDPSDEAAFEDFKTHFDSDSYKSDISDLLIDNSAMRLLYSQLVSKFRRI
jgi:hypothetical protein